MMWTSSSSSSSSSSSIAVSSLLLLVILLYYDASCLHATVSAVETSATSGASATMTSDAELHDVNNNDGKENSEPAQQHHQQKQKRKQYSSSEQPGQKRSSLLIDRSTYRHNTRSNNNNNNNNAPLISEMLHYRTLWQKISIHFPHFKKEKHDDAQVEVAAAESNNNNNHFQQISSNNNLEGQQYNIDDVTIDVKEIITSDDGSTVVNSVGDFNIENARWVWASCPSPSSEDNDHNHDETDDDDDDDDTKAVEVVVGDTNDDECDLKDRGKKSLSSDATLNNNECRHKVDDVGRSSTIDENDNNNHDEDADDDVQAGMVLYVADSSFDSTSDDDSLERGGSSDSGREEENAVSTTTTTTTTAAAAAVGAGGSACQTELSRHYDGNEDIIQYILLQQESHLGNIDVHKRDFAYNPVVATMSRDDTFKVGNRQHRVGRSSSRRQDRSKGSINSSSKALETRIREEDESVEASFRSRHSHSSWSQGEDDDHQISFRWWSWFAHLSQLLNTGHYKFHKTFGSTNRDNINRQSQSSSSSSMYQSNIYEETGKFAFAGGSHGEVWRARRRCPTDTQPRGNSTQSASCDDGKDLIVKRLKVEQGYLVLEAGLREVYFGELLAREVDSSILFTTYVDHFFRKGRRGQVELWIVFENGGPSLRSYLYEATVAMDGFVMFQHSEFWRRLRMGITASHRHKRRHKMTDDLPNSKNDDDDDGNDSSEEVEGRHLLKEVLKQIVRSGNVSIFSLVRVPLQTT